MAGTVPETTGNASRQPRSTAFLPEHTRVVGRMTRPPERRPAHDAIDNIRRPSVPVCPSAAGAVAGMPATRAETVPAATGFGPPLVELRFPAGALSVEQKAAMIKGVTEVIKTTKLADHANKLWAQIFETAAGGWGAGGQVFVPRGQ